uniref:Armadillo repeat containing 7 n=1 Tax=Molossus molossus TaxID=27622 RepID=A0A7J8CVP1_MOLMO|nr:armadillo repeat containing 7 [Molossus molossus]
MAQKPKVDPHVGRLGYLQALVTEFQETESQGESAREGGRGRGRGSARDRRPGPGSSAAFPSQTPRSKSWPTSPTSPMTPATTSICDSCRSWICSSIRCRKRMRPWWSLLLVRRGPSPRCLMGGGEESELEVSRWERNLRQPLGGSGRLRGSHIVQVTASWSQVWNSSPGLLHSCLPSC